MKKEKLEYGVQDETTKSIDVVLASTSETIQKQDVKSYNEFEILVKYWKEASDLMEIFLDNGYDVVICKIEDTMNKFYSVTIKERK